MSPPSPCSGFGANSQDAPLSRATGIGRRARENPRSLFSPPSHSSGARVKYRKTRKVPKRDLAPRSGNKAIAADLDGASDSTHHARSLTGTPVEFIVDKDPWAGRVASFEELSEFDGEILMEVDFEGGDVPRGDFNYTEIFRGAEAYLQRRVPNSDLRGPLELPGMPQAAIAPPCPWRARQRAAIPSILASPALLRNVLPTPLMGMEKYGVQNRRSARRRSGHSQLSSSFPDISQPRGPLDREAGATWAH